MPEDIHVTLWGLVESVILSGCIAVTKEIYDEMVRIDGRIGRCFAANSDLVLMEVGKGNWDWTTYATHIQRMQNVHKDYISDFHNGRKATVGLNDISIIALGLTLNLPVVNMEAIMQQPSPTKKRIPEVCDLDRASHFVCGQVVETTRDWRRGRPISSHVI